MAVLWFVTLLSDASREETKVTNKCQERTRCHDGEVKGAVQAPASCRRTPDGNPDPDPDN